MVINRMAMLLLAILLFYIPVVNYWFNFDHSTVSLGIQIILLIIICYYFILHKGNILLNKRFAKFFLPIILLCVLILISYFSYIDISYYFQKVNGFMLNVFFQTIILYFLLTLKKFNTDLFIKYTFLIGILLTISTFHYMINNNISILNPRGVYFIEDNQILTGRLFGFHLIQCVYVFFMFKEKFYKILSFVFFIFDIIFTFTAGSRQVILSLGILAICCLFAFIKFNAKKTITFLTVILISSIFFLDKIISSLSGTYLFRRLEANMFESSSRVSLYYDTISIIFNDISNFLFGIGFSNFKFKSMFHYDYPHNLFLEVFVELGLIGLFITVYFILSVIIKSTPIIIKMKSPITLIMMVCFCYFLLISMFSFNINSNNYIFIFGLICIYYSLEKKPKQT